MISSKIQIHECGEASAFLQASDYFVLPTRTLYLDAAAQGPRLRSVLMAGQASLEAGAQPWKLTFTHWEAQIEDLRALAADLLFESDVEGVAMVPSVAFGISTAARNLPLQPGQEVLVLEGQFPSNLLPWQQRCTEVGAIVIAAKRELEEDWTEAVMRAWDKCTQLQIVSLPHTHWLDGSALNMDRIAQRARESSTFLVLDLSQSLGVLPAELGRWQPDFVVSVGHKWLLGPHGLAWLWAAPQWRDQGVGLDQHWQARQAGDQWHFPATQPPPYRAGARRFDAGGVADPTRLAMATAALAQLRQWGLANIARRLDQLIAELNRALDAHGLEKWKTPGHGPHFTGLRAPDAAQYSAATNALAAHGVVYTARGGLLRIAPHLHIRVSDMARTMQIVAWAVQPG